MGHNIDFVEFNLNDHEIHVQTHTLYTKRQFSLPHNRDPGKSVQHISGVLVVSYKLHRKICSSMCSYSTSICVHSMDALRCLHNPTHALIYNRLRRKIFASARKNCVGSVKPCLVCIEQTLSMHTFMWILQWNVQINISFTTQNKHTHTHAIPKKYHFCHSKCFVSHVQSILILSQPQS